MCFAAQSRGPLPGPLTVGGGLSPAATWETWGCLSCPQHPGPGAMREQGEARDFRFGR